MYYHLLKPVVNAIRNHTWRDIWDAARFPHGYFGWKYIPDSIKKSVVFENEFCQKVLPTESVFENIWRKYGKMGPRDVIPHIDFSYQLPEEFLFMTDRFSMAHAIEARVPFLDHELVEMVYSIPNKIRTGQNDPKEFMKQMLSDMIPAEVLCAPKRGFRLPLKEWTRGSLRTLISDMLSPDALRKQGIFSSKLYDSLIRPHLEGRTDRTEWVWTLLMFQLWHKKFINK